MVVVVVVVVVVMMMMMMMMMTTTMMITTMLNKTVSIIVPFLHRISVGANTVFKRPDKQIQYRLNKHFYTTKLARIPHKNKSLYSAHDLTSRHFRSHVGALQRETQETRSDQEANCHSNGAARFRSEIRSSMHSVL